MTHFHALSAICIGKSTIFISQNSLPLLSSFPVLGQETPFSGYKLAPGYQKILREQIFEYFIFWVFLAPLTHPDFLTFLTLSLTDAEFGGGAKDQSIPNLEIMDD